MKIGLLYLNEIKYDDLAWVFVKNGIDSEIIDTGISVDSTDAGDAEIVVGQLKANGIDLAITMDFCPAVSDACEKCGAQYLAWIYDEPQQALFNKQITNSHTHIFSFDKNQTKELQKMGASDVVHFPLATNVYRNAGLIVDRNDEKKYGCNISFIGNLYVDDFYDRIYEKAGNKARALMDNVLLNAFGKWDGTDRLSEGFDESARDELINLCGFQVDKNNIFSIDPQKYLSARLFSRKLANLERVEIAKRLSSKGFRLYTTSRDLTIEGVDIRKELSYDEELPKAYHLSRINLNITLHSITSGIPLRVFDIMGVGGFVLSNYQPEIEEFFSIGKDIEVFRTLDELEDKVRFYLTHDDIRSNIAVNGYKRVSEKYSYDAAFWKMMEHLGVRS